MVTRGIGLTLTIAGLVLVVWFIQMLLLEGPAPLETFPVAAIGVAMVSVGLRYVLKSKPKKPEPSKPD